MKKITHIFTVLFVVLTTTSCEDFLDKKPQDMIGSDTELNETDAIALINSAYQPLQWAKLYNMRMWTTDIIANDSEAGGDMSSATDGIETKDLASFIATSANAGSLDLWRGPNPGILRCNIVLERVGKMEINPDLKNRILGEAYFLRAHYYFIMVRIFGDVPMRTAVLIAGDNMKIARTPKDQVYEQIISDCRNAISMLPPKSEYSSADLGRACRESALAMLAKIYLTLNENYTEIVSLCEQIEDMGYDLSTMRYEDNFGAARVKNGPESLFEIQYTGSTQYDFWGNDNQSSWLSTFMGPRNSNWVGGSWGWQHVKQEFVDQYEAGDKRKDVTILYSGCPKFDGKDYDPAWSSTGYNVRKFLVPKSISPDYNTNPSNFIVYRFADVLLMKAEALNELGLTKEAQTPLNKVRARAGLQGITTTDKTTMKEAIIKERRIELAFEGHRWFDLIRIDGGDYALKFFHSIGKTNATKDRLLWPVPQEEIDDNPLITQNPGY
ncbi:MAG: RagB/SusD family nutrient uptake outer membrane protein [Dysgonamonadaceae bacterium]|jgi:hypothetical protein|nr:RagB/SusD family nutrient uptake outer membrane protein [Dysgonamonadaceae bacterium]